VLAWLKKFQIAQVAANTAELTEEFKHFQLIAWVYC
jgi:hypothetical protein